MTEVLAAVITFVGTLVVGGAGFWQWRRAHAHEAGREYRARRVETLKAVWEAVSDVEESQRASFLLHTNEQGRDQVRAVNLLLLRSAPFLLDDERQWAATIVQHVLELDTLIRARHELRLPDVDWWLTSAMQPEASNVVAVAASRLLEAKTAFSERYAAVVRGNRD